jgi:hypothetical protein
MEVRVDRKMISSISHVLNCIMVCILLIFFWEKGVGEQHCGTFVSHNQKHVMKTSYYP